MYAHTYTFMHKIRFPFCCPIRTTIYPRSPKRRQVNTSDSVRCFPFTSNRSRVYLAEWFVHLREGAPTKTPKDSRICLGIRRDVNQSVHINSGGWNISTFEGTSKGEDIVGKGVATIDKARKREIQCGCMFQLLLLLPLKLVFVRHTPRISSWEFLGSAGEGFPGSRLSQSGEAGKRGGASY